MDFLTVDMVKMNCRVEDYSKDPDRQRKIDDTIKKCAILAEGLVYDHIGKNYFAIMKEYGEIPAPIRRAALMATSDMILSTWQHPENNPVFKVLLRPYKQKEL